MKTASISHKILNLESPNKWEIEQVDTPISFNELLISWNGFRPKRGYWAFSVSVFQTKWSDYLPLAFWGHRVQKTFNTDSLDSFAKCNQDIITIKAGYSTAYRVRVEARDGATLDQLHSLTASFSKPAEMIKNIFLEVPSISIKGFPASSQLILDHPRAKDFCSPTATTAVINFFSPNKRLDPIFFATQVCDATFNVYGNWILNIAAAYEALEGQYSVYVTRLPDFTALHSQLRKGLPVIVSVQGPLLGALYPYQFGHLLVVTGYDHITREVFCMDPAYPSNEETITSYSIEEFLMAWTDRKRNISYLFEKNNDFKGHPFRGANQ